MDTMRGRPLFHLSTFVMEKSEDDLEEDIREFVDQIYHSKNRSEAIDLRSNALEFIDQWRLQKLEQLDQRVRTAGQLILNAFDQYQNKRQRVRCPHRLKQSAIDLSEDQYHSEKKTKTIEISIDRLTSPSPNRTISFNSIDFGRDCTFEILANVSSTSPDIAMTICENNILIYSEHGNELMIVSLIHPKQIISKQLNKNIIIHDLCYVDWLLKCLIIADEEIYLFDYRTREYEIIESGIGYISGAIDNQHRIFYLIKQTTIYKYDENSLVTLQVDQYPIADGYRSRRVVLDNKSNDYLALLVIASDEKNYILVYATQFLDNGYIYKIMIDDRIERQWICSNGNEGWLIGGSSSRSCFDLNIHGLISVRVFDCNELRNIIPMNEHQRFLLRTDTKIFLMIRKTSSVHSF